ncbi:PrsW family glutamic-type intramembrane protease [Gemella bergeri]
MNITILRVITSIGGHLAWTAIAGGALTIAKRDKNLELSHFMKSQFIFFFSSIILMHAL